ncbi:MAG: orc1/cdc6 family replication initiation protein [Candidatus Aenigmarchaeota archaeon]|nr:orc1/cdc6 family replication initiation protein [Candidatus Aenigmarchaeota archaeon]
MESVTTTTANNTSHIAPSISANIFSQYIQNEGVFKDKKFLSSSFIPQTIPHREQEIQHISSMLAPVLKGYNPNNVFIYGTCGTGKTICTKFVLGQLADISKNKVTTLYVNCKMKKVADTEYRLFAQMLKDLNEFVPDTGLPTDVLYRKFFARIEERKMPVIIVLDEIDVLLKKVGDEFLYNLTRINTELVRSHVTVIGITNDLACRDRLDARVKSSLSEEEIMFKPYNAVQLKDILGFRATMGFREGAIEDGALSKCAALAAQEHGDARRALDLMRVAGEVADRLGERVVTEKHVDMAEQKISLDRITEAVRIQPKQSQAVLYSALLLEKRNKSQKKWTDSRLLTGDVYNSYKTVCEKGGMKALTQRRVSDLISELDMLGIINARIISKGRHGRTREISLDMAETTLEKVEKLLMDRFE